MCFTEKKDDFVCCICLSKNEYLDNYYNNNDTNYYSQSNLKTYKIIFFFSKTHYMINKLVFK